VRPYGYSPVGRTEPVLDVGELRVAWLGYNDCDHVLNSVPPILRHPHMPSFGVGLDAFYLIVGLLSKNSKKLLTRKLFRHILFMEFKVQVRNSRLEKSLLNKIARVANSLEHEVEKELKVSLKLTFSQLRVLNGLLVLEEASQRQLAVALEVTPAVITRQADVLSRQGLVEMKARSKRENVLALTDKGRGAVEDGTQIVEGLRVKALSALSRKDEVAFENAVDLMDHSVSQA
jgi:DNA-binding MarR family transcriptional regulator